MNDPKVTIRMGAPYWDITVHSPHTVIDMRKLDEKQQRRVIFEVVKACREGGRVVT